MQNEATDKNIDKEAGQTSELINQNIESILTFYKREEEKLSRPQLFLESSSNFIGSIYFLGLVVIFVTCWILINLFAKNFGWVEFDPIPFVGLAGIISFFALITATVVLIKQNRIAKLEEQRAHLELQVNLLTEQKTTKLIYLIEELRRDLPMVHNRHDAEATALQQPTNPEHVLSAIDEWHELSGNG